MTNCANHPDKKATLICMKYNLHLCDGCITCRDPKLYCKHRTACTIWFLAKSNEKDAEI